MDHTSRIKKIILPYGGMGKMAKAIGCNRTTVEEALRFTRDTTLQNKIRKDAIRFYGGKFIEY